LPHLDKTPAPSTRPDFLVEHSMFQPQFCDSPQNKNLAAVAIDRGLGKFPIRYGSVGTLIIGISKVISISQDARRLCFVFHNNQHLVLENISYRRISPQGFEA
jgi:hypothetical protein